MHGSQPSSSQDWGSQWANEFQEGAPYVHMIEPEVLENGVKMWFSVIMVILWTLFGVLGVQQLPLLHLWCIIGGLTIIIGFVMLGPLGKYHE